MRLPNGYGGVCKLSGNRRKPFGVRLTTEYCPDGKQRQKQRYLGYYATRVEALAALADYNCAPFDLDVAHTTFAKMYDRWCAKLGNKLPSYAKSAYANLAPLHKMTMATIKRRHVQAAVDAINLSGASKNNARIIVSKVFNYAADLDLVRDNPAHGVIIPGDAPSTMHHPFSDEEIAILWQHNDDFSARTALVLIYTGMRPVELCRMKSVDVHLSERYMVGGVKTKAGRNRVIPIAQKILPIIADWYDSARPLLLMFDGKPLTTDSLGLCWKRSAVLRSLPTRHLPHDGRHTCATLLDNADVNLRTIQLILGHAGGTLTRSVYTHKTTRQLIEAVDKI